MVDFKAEVRYGVMLFKEPEYFASRETLEYAIEQHPEVFMFRPQIDNTIPFGRIECPMVGTSIILHEPEPPATSWLSRIWKWRR